MRRFTQLFHEVDRTTRTSEKTAALRRYFEEAPAKDAAWAVAVLTGRKLIRAVAGKRLRSWVQESTGLPGWLISECHSRVGDLSETIALLVPQAGVGADEAGQGDHDEPLHRVIEERILPLPHMSESQQREVVLGVWRDFDTPQCFLFHKLISANFRFGAARKVVINALAAAVDIDPAVMQHRLSGTFKPTAASYRQLLEGDDDNAARPYPFYLASALENQPGQTLGDIRTWQAEWKWDGIRAQLIRRGGTSLVWTRGDELVTDAFPELGHVCGALPDGTVLDGELLAWDDSRDRPLPFARLQTRLNRKRVEMMLFNDTPVVFMAYDVLEVDGGDVREASTQSRREMLASVVQRVREGGGDDALMLSPLVEAKNWEELGQLRELSRERGVEGLMLKRLDSAYGTGRQRGLWWKWKVSPFTADCVMVYAQRGSGRRSSLFTDYTFAVWTGEVPGAGELTPVAKAYSGLTDEEINRVDRFIRHHTVGRRGAFRQVEPTQVFEIAFEGIRHSDRHKSGIAVRFPRIHRWREDKTAAQADTLGTMQGLLRLAEGEVSG